MASTVTEKCGRLSLGVSDSDSGVVLGQLFRTDAPVPFAPKTRTWTQTIERRMKGLHWASVPVPRSRTSVPLH